MRILQITDPHLFACPNARLMGVNTAATLDQVLGIIISDYLDADCLLVTGDLSQDNSAASYRYLKEKLTLLGMPHFWLCGNHDQSELMEQINPTAMNKQIILQEWQILLLNTQQDGEVFGHLSQAELEYLDRCLLDNHHKHSLLAMHHHPAPINSWWMDQIMLKNSEELAQILARHHNIRGIIHGHTHQARDYRFADLSVMATPSTCVQFAPHSDQFCVDTLQPGFRVLDLHPDGKLDTHVVRVSDEPLKIDGSSKGY